MRFLTSNQQLEIDQIVLLRIHSLIFVDILQKYTNNESIITSREHTHTSILWPFVWDNQGELVPSPTHTHPAHQPSFISFLHLPQTIASSLLNLRARQSFRTTSNHVLFGLPPGLEPSTSYSIHFFTQSLSSFRNTRPCHRNLCFAVVLRSCPLGKLVETF